MVWGRGAPEVISANNCHKPTRAQRYTLPPVVDEGSRGSRRAAEGGAGREGATLRGAKRVPIPASMRRKGPGASLRVLRGLKNVPFPAPGAPEGASPGGWDERGRLGTGPGWTLCFPKVSPAPVPAFYSISCFCFCRRRERRERRERGFGESLRKHSLKPGPAPNRPLPYSGKISPT